MSAAEAHAQPAPAERPLPPIAEIAVATLVLIVIGGVYMAAHMPHGVPLALPWALLGCAAVLLAANCVMLARLREFAWPRFRQVGGWALLAYIVIAGMLEYVFLYDGISGTPLVVVTLMLVVFALDVPLLLGFSVARYEEV